MNDQTIAAQLEIAHAPIEDRDRSRAADRRAARLRQLPPHLAKRAIQTANRARLDRRGPACRRRDRRARRIGADVRCRAYPGLN